MKRYSILLLVTALFHCQAMEKVRPVDPLKWAAQLQEEENPSADDITICLRSLGKLLPLDELNECEMARTGYVNGGKAKRIAGLSAMTNASQEKIMSLGGTIYNYKNLLRELEKYLAAVSRPAETLEDPTLENEDESSREKIVLNEMISTMSFILFAPEERSEKYDERKRKSFENLRDLVLILAPEIAIDTVMVNEKPSDSSSEEEMIVREKEAFTAIDEDDETPVEVLLEKFSDAVSAIEAVSGDETASIFLLNDESSIDEGTVQLDKEISRHSNKVPQGELVKDECILNAIDQDVKRPETHEQRALMRYSSLVRKVLVLEGLVVQNEKLLNLLFEEQVRDLEELDELKEQRDVVTGSSQVKLEEHKEIGKAKVALKALSKKVKKKKTDVGDFTLVE